MEINRHNYETYFLDYLEGKLDLSDNSDFMNFLKENPDLADELNQFENITIHSNEIIYKEKNILKKFLSNTLIINDNNFEELCIAKLEGDLSENDNNHFNKFLEENSLKKQVFELYLKTILQPDKTIFFKEKSKLKINQIKRNYSLPFVISMAASVCLIILVYKYILNNKPIPVKQIVITENRNQDAINNKNKSYLFTDQKSVMPLLKKSVNKNNLSADIIKDDKSKIDRNTLRRNNSIMNSLNSIKINELKQPYSEIADHFLVVKENRNNVIEKDNSLLSQNFGLKGAEREINNYFNNIKNQGTFNFWQLASSGIKELSKITGSNIKYTKKVNSHSNRTIYSFNSKLLSFYNSHENK